MSKYDRVDAHKSHDRVLLTEVAPFELPPNLINVGYFSLVLGSELRLEDKQLSWRDRQRSSDAYLALLIAGGLVHSDVHGPSDGRFSLELDRAPWKLPYRFWVRKSDGQKRTLSLPHPLTQLAIVSFYRRYGEVVAFHTSRSDFSLRHPDSIARFSFTEDQTHRKRKSNRRDGIEIAGAELESVGSFYRYRRYSNINKFYESRQFHDLEARFPFQRRLDITRCFESLYTHSVDWAVRGHHASKHGIKEDIFSTKLDQLFQSANNGQTNGVIVGPEFSRIFAEVILQSVDLEVQTELSRRHMEFDQKYWIGRYVDDFFIFCEDAQAAATIQDVIEVQLEKFNLRLNRAKQVDFEGPSFSPIHTAKQRIARRISRFYRRVESQLAATDVNGRRSSVDSLISEYKADLHDLGVKPPEVNNFILGVIEKRVVRLGRHPVSESRQDGELLVAALRDTAILVEFLYAASASVPSALRASRILLQTVKLSEKANLDRDLQMSVRSAASRAVVAILDRHNLESPELAGAERFYWLLLHGELGRSWLLPEAALRYFIDRTSREGSDYLLIVTSLLYMQNRNRYAGLREELLDRVESIVEGLRPQVAERAMLQADMLSCPYVSDTRKLHWMGLWFPDRSSTDNIDALSNWPAAVFAAWKGFDLEKALQAKRSREVY